MGKAQKGALNKSSKAAGGGRVSGPTLDLHGRRVDEVFDAVEVFLRRNTGADVVRIMPGKGTGKVREEVIRYLKLAGYGYTFERLANGSANDGVLIVRM